MQSEPSGGITADDCILFATIFEGEVARLFPVPVTVCLSVAGDTSTALVVPDVPKHLHGKIVAIAAEQTPAYVSGQLYIPLKLTEGQAAVFVISGADPALLKKFSAGWLADFQNMLHDHIQLIRQIYLNPETGLYNSRALEFFLRYSPEVESPYSIYLVSTFFIRRSTTGSFRKIQYLAGFFSAISPGVLFFLGQGVFALLVAGKDRRKRLAMAHTLQRRLKREGLQKVQIAFTDFQKGNDRMYSELQRALVIAERRGPFGLCDTDVLKNAEKMPFALPDNNKLKVLRKLWRGVDQFGLALLQRDNDHQEFESVEALLLPLLSGQEQTLALSQDQVFIFIPNASANLTESRVRKLAETIERQHHVSVSVGACSFSCLNYTKTDMVRNCRKALMHADYYGPGSLVFFDYLSLNVSGDWYFDEGDFRQAVIEYSQGLKLSPGESNLLNSLGVALIEMNRYHSAMASFNEVLKKDSDNYMALVNLGYACQMLGRDTSALEYFEKAFAVQYHPDISGADIYQQLSRLYCRTGRYDKALPVLLRWQKAKGGEKDYLLYRLLGEAYTENGKPTDAMKALQQALQLYPHDIESMSMLGLLYVEFGEGEDAGLLLLEKAISIDDSSADSWYRLSRAFHHLGKMEDALDGVRRCLQLKRNHVQAILLLGNILLSSGKVKQASSVFHRVLRAKNCLTSERRLAEEAIVALEESINQKKQVNS